MPRRYRPHRTAQVALNHKRKKQLAWWIFSGLCAFAVLVLVVFAEVLLPFIIGGIIAYLFTPVVNWLASRGIPRIFSILMVYAVFIGSIYSFAVYMFPMLEVESQSIARRMRNAPDTFSQVVHSGGAWIEDLFEPGIGTSTRARTESLESMAHYGVGPDTYRVGTGGGSSFPTLKQRGAKSIWAPGSELPERLGISTIRPKAGDDPGIQLLATQNNQNTSYRLKDSVFEFRQLRDGVFQLRSRDEPQFHGGAEPDDIRLAIRDSVDSVANEFTGKLVLGLVATIRGLFKLLSQGLVSLIVTFMVGAFIMLDFREIKRFYWSLVPKRFEAHFDEFLGRLDGGLAGAIRGQLLICVVNGALSAIGLIIFVPEYWVVLAVLATVMSLVPIFGTIISTIPACLLALSSGGMSAAVPILLWILGIHFVEANILNPKIIGHHAKINPVVVVFVLIAGEFAFGIKGVILAVPVTAVVLAMCQFIYARIRPTLMRG
jgi:predicted PurR-regulated permease PerM